MPFTNLYFDLDDTLYPPASGLWDAIRDRMNIYMQKFIDLPIDEISALRKSYLETYGTTLRGLQAHYSVDADDYLAFVHDLPLDQYIQPDPSLRGLLQSLPQRRWVFTNSDFNHARRVMDIIGIGDCFDGIIDIKALNFACKPDILAYQRALSFTQNNDPSRCVIFDDSLRNLTPAHEMGFYTVLVGKNGGESAADKAILCLHDLKEHLPELWHEAERG
jgi:putative hydrolase of the HAD superfamily